MVGGTVGYNWRAPGTPWVFGLPRGDVDWAGVNGGTTACGSGTTCETKSTWFGTARGRIGYAVDRLMPYFTGGAAFGNIQANRTGFAGNSDSSVSWTIGASTPRRPSSRTGAPSSSTSTPTSAT